MFLDWKIQFCQNDYTTQGNLQIQCNPYPTTTGIFHRTRTPEINPCTYGHLIFDKGGKNIQWRTDSFFNNWCWQQWTATCKRMKLEHSLTQYTKINSKWIKDLNVRPDTKKLLEENKGRTLFDINCSNIFLDPSPRVMAIRTKINKLNVN